MKGLVLAPLLVAATAALPEIFVEKRDKHTNGATQHFARGVGLDKRAGTLSTNVYDVLSWSTGGAYYANVTVGTPPQNQVVILDTGSADLYFDASDAQTCQTQGAHSCQGGTFNPKNSKSFSVAIPSPAFNTSFGDGSTAVGPYGKDFVGIGDVVISNVQFGVAETVNSTTGYAIGLMGVGYSAIEAAYTPYPNMPEVLVDAGVINSRLYSVFLNDENDISGSILFGGIDTTRYTGTFATLDLLPDEVTNFVDQFISVVTAVNATVGGKTTNFFSGGSPGVAAYNSRDKSLPVLLDTGSTAWSVPTDYYERFFAPTFSYVDKYGLCSCAHANSGDSVTLEFGGKVQITVPAREFIVPLYNSTTKQAIPYDAHNNACLFLISPEDDSYSGFLTLGDAILRSMYVVFDLDNGQVTIGQANLNNTASPNIVTVSAGPTGVAQAVKSVVTAATNSYTVAPAVASGTGSFSASTASSTIGTATGVNAIPETARISGQANAAATGSSSGSSSGGNSQSAGSGSSPSPTSSKGAAAGLVLPGADLGGMWVTSLAVFFAAVGAGLMM